MRVGRAGLQVGKFGVVGILNTLIDYVLFMALTKIFSIPLTQVWIAKAISGTAAIVNSFYLNRRWVFRAEEGGRGVRQGLRFIGATVIGVYIIQTSLTQLFSSSWPILGEESYKAIDWIGLAGLLPGVLTEAFVIKTVAFSLATAVSLSWNFLLYKYWVFRDPGWKA